MSINLNNSTKSFLFPGDITQKGYEKKRKKLLTPFFQANTAKEQPPLLTTQSVEEQVHILNPSAPPAEVAEVVQQPQLEAVAIASVISPNKNDLKIPSFIPVNSEATKRETEPSSSALFEPDTNSEEITLLPSTSSGVEGAPAVPPHREGSGGEVDKKLKNGKPRSRNRHKR